MSGDRSDGRDILIRADASAAIGAGHVARTLALADALRQRGNRVRFAMRAQASLMCETVRAHGHEVDMLREPDPGITCDRDDAEGHDATAVLALLARMPADIVIVDHYHLGQAWEERIGAHVATVLAIDDLGRTHSSTMVLDSGFGSRVAERYVGKLAEGCVRLFGSDYALLAPVYGAAAMRRRVRDGRIRRGVVFFGGADATGETEKVLACLHAPAFAHWEVDVVSLATGARWTQLARMARSRPHTRLHGMLPHLADLYESADLAIGAGGVSTWERLACGVPSLVTIITPNQRELTHALARCGAIHVAGEASDMTPARYDEVIRQLPQPLPPPTVAVDGRGADRVAEALLAAARVGSGGRFR